MQEMEQAWIDHDFQSFAKLTMTDSNQFHSTCLDTYPPIFYLNDTSRDIIRLVTAYNEYHGNDKLRVAYSL
jgi:diphosphomevalonate decarboxylase